MPNEATAEAVKVELSKYINPEKAEFFPRFFKTGVGQYGEGDKFIGVTVPDQRRVVKQFRNINLAEIAELLKSEVHEHRLTGVLILVHKYEKAKTPQEKTAVFDFYLAQSAQVNNWDIVDASARQIVGAYLYEFGGAKALLPKLAQSKSLWEQRIAIIATHFFISKENYEPTFQIAELLLHHPHDLIHKAVGWMLREVGNRNHKSERTFLDKFYREMPRTMLRYAIEKFPEQERKSYLAK